MSSTSTIESYSEGIPRCTELQFADDTATTRAGAEDALHKYIEAAADFGLTVSTPKTKLMVSQVEERQQGSNPCG